MSAIPKTAFTPTADTDGNPTTCFCCGMRAIGIGLNRTDKGDPQYICKRCVMAINDYKKIKGLDAFEIQALDGGVDAVGEWINERGIGTELAHYDELDQRMLVKAAWEGCARRLREVIAGGTPF